MSEEKYRLEAGAVFEYNQDHNAYVFIGNLNGEDFDAWIEDYEQNYFEYNSSLDE